MVNRVKHKRSAVQDKVPLTTDLELGQIAINTYDGKMFIKKDNGSESIVDITKSIYQNDTNVTVNDATSPSTNGEVLITADGVNNVRVTSAQVQLKTDTLIENANELRFLELTSNGPNFAALRAPDLLNADYVLKLPQQDSTTFGQLLGTNGAGQLGWYDADVFGGNRIYVSAAKGDDLNDGINAPVKTIKKALQIASGKVYNSDGTVNGQRWNVSVAAGDYVENNPIIVPDNVSVIGDGLRACILRPLNSGLDMLRVRTGCYFTEFTFRDAVNVSGVPNFTWDYAVAFDDPLDAGTSRVGYTYLPTTKPVINISPYIQNCSIISFLGGNGVLVDGSKVVTPNAPQNQIEAENPVSGPAPEQGKSMVANAFTMLSFGGTGWRVINDAYVQIVSCFQIFMLNGTYTQSGGYCSITNSATNFGLYALRASGYSPNAFSFDKGYIGSVGTSGIYQTIDAFGMLRPEGPVEEFVVRLYDPNTNADLTDTYKNNLPTYLSVGFNSASATTVILATDTFNIPGHGFLNGDAVTYYNNGGTSIGGLTEKDTYYVNIIDLDNFKLYYDNSFTRLVDLTSLGVGSQTFKRQDYELYVDKILETHNVFQTLTLNATGTGGFVFAPGDSIDAIDTVTGQPHKAYIYSYNSGTRDLVVSVNKVTIGVDQVRNPFTVNSRITAINSSSVTYEVDTVANRDDLWASTFRIAPTAQGGLFGSLSGLPGKKIWFHRPSITNSSSHTWEYAGSGTDYNALPQNGGKGNPLLEQYSENAGRVYTSGTNELGDFKVGNFITAYNRTGNIVFKNEVSVETLTALKLSLSDVEITGISVDPDLGENESGGPSDSRLTTQKAIWSYANNRLGDFIDKSVSTNAVPGNIVQLNANGQINRDLIPSQRSFNSFVSNGYKSRLNIVDDIPTNDAQSGDISTENYEQIELTLSGAVTANDGDLIIQANTGATGYVKGATIASPTVVVASINGTFEGTEGAFDTNPVNTITIAGDSTPSDANTAVYVTLTQPITTASTNYFLASSNDSQYLITSSATSFTFTNVNISTAVRFNGTAYIKTATPHNLLTYDRVNISSASDNFDENPYITVIDSDEFYYTSSGGNSTATGTTTATATVAGATGTSTTATFLAAALTGTVNLGDYAFGSNLPKNSKVTNVAGTTTLTVTISWDSSTTIAGGTNQVLNFITPIAETGTVRSIVTAADSLANGAYTETRTGVITDLNNLTFTQGSGYVPGTYLRVPLTNVSGSGTGAKANIVVGASGSVIDVDVMFGGTGYVIGNVLSASNTNLGGTGSGFQIPVTGVEQRIYVDIVGGELFVATSGAIDFVEDNNSPRNTIANAAAVSTQTFNGGAVGAGGSVDTVNSRITITSHGYTNGDPVEYDPGANTPVGGLTTLNVYYVKVINANTIELYGEYSLTNLMLLSSTSTGTHSLNRYSVNLTDNSLYVPGHGLATGDAIRMTGLDLPEIDAVAIADNSYFFVGSITTNSFTLHELRSDALASTGGVTQEAYNITNAGTGTITLIDNDITVTGVVNTSSRLVNNWNVLVPETIDASNIVSGIVNTSRLGTGDASTLTFLRGDSSWAPAVQNITSGDANVVSVTGTGSTSAKYGDVTIDVTKVNQAASSGNFGTTGVASYYYDHFVVGTGGGLSAGQVQIRSSGNGGTVDADKLDGQDGSFYLDPDNFSEDVPVSQGGTGLGTFSVGDMTYATSSTRQFGVLGIGVPDSVMTVNTGGTAPQWSQNLSLARNISLTNPSLVSSSSAASSVFNTTSKALNIGGEATSITIGSNTSTESLTSNVTTYTTGGSSSTTVTANIPVAATIVLATAVNSGITIFDFASTTGVLVGQLVQGSASIPAGTTVIGVNATKVYLSAATSNTISAGTSITFTNTPGTLGLKPGDQITIAGETGNTNLNGTWPITSAGTSSNSFNFKITTAVTLTNDARVGTVVKENSLLIRNRSLVIGSSEASATPVAANIRAENAVGTNLSGAALTLRGGLSTGTGTGGVINFATGTTGTTGDVQQAEVTRMTVAQSAAATTLDLTTAMTTANVFVDPTTVSAFTGATTLTLGATSGTMNLRNATITAANATTVNINGASPTIASTSTGTLTLFNTAITGVDAFGVATSVNVATGATSTINLGNTSSTARVGILNVQNRAYTTTNSTTGITDAAAVLVDSFDFATFRSGEYTMQITCTAGTNNATYQISKVLVIHDNTTSTLTEYGLVKTGATELATFTTNINGLNVEILAQASSGNTITVQLTRTLQTV